mmetsp:Transcript_55188/g.49680  ORF Transcript_55188/g.49680 Transcript_55188/m.49680 type:complete len:252 (-) Transcript_55188:120-875(-)
MENKVFSFLLIIFIECISAQFSSKNNNNDGTKNVGNEVNLWLNAVILLVLIVLFVYSVRFSPKCRRRRRKLPHEIRLERTNKQKHAQFKDLNKSLKKSSSFLNKLYKNNQDDQYINIDDDEYDDNIDIYNDDLYGNNIPTDNTDNITESKDSDYDDDDEDDDDMSVSIDDLINDNSSDNNTADNANANGNMLESGKLLINNLNHYIQTQYDEYKDNHSNFMQDILGMNSYNNPQDQYKDPSTKRDEDYDQL